MRDKSKLQENVFKSMYFLQITRRVGCERNDSLTSNPSVPNFDSVKLYTEVDQEEVGDKEGAHRLPLLSWRQYFFRIHSNISDYCFFFFLIKFWHISESSWDTHFLLIILQVQLNPINIISVRYCASLLAFSLFVVHGPYKRRMMYESIYFWYTFRELS